MSKIYRTSDTVALNLDGLVVKISPLSYKQKMDVQAEILTGDTRGAMNAAALAVKYALKDIQGLEDSEGNPYQLKFENGKVADECWDDLQNIKEGQKLIMVCLNLMNSVPKDFVDPNTGKKLEGVSLIKSEAPKPKKK
jgi:hypothetical protein